MIRNLWACIFVLSLLAGCGSMSNGDSVAAVSVSSGSANEFNPYMHSRLPNMRPLTPEGEKMMGAMGGRGQSIEGEAAHRQNWRDEIYPVVFGDKKAPGEIMVLLDFSNKESAHVWQQVVDASKSLSPASCKIVLFGRSQENYGTDLLGLAIWIAHSRPGQAMNYVTYALKSWNDAKAKLAARGITRKFTNEYDATASASDFPIHYAYFSRLNPPIPQQQEPQVGKYCYDAGSVNMFQANQICQYYGISKLPAVIVNGKVLSNISAQSILAALK